MEAARTVQKEPEVFHLHVSPLLDLSACGALPSPPPRLRTACAAYELASL